MSYVLYSLKMCVGGMYYLPVQDKSNKTRSLSNNGLCGFEVRGIKRQKKIAGDVDWLGPTEVAFWRRIQQCIAA